MNAELLVTTRGDLTDTIQRGHIAIVDTQGNLIAWCGDAHSVTYMRSSAKPFQALLALQSSAAARFDLAGSRLAILCASHYGEPEHVEAVRDVLQRADVSETALRCGTHAPAYQPAAVALWRSGSEPSVLHNSCSGKHAGMLAAARALGTPLENYLSQAHPVQQGITAILSALSDVPAQQIITATDGCSAPTYGLPLSAMARAYAHLAQPDSVPAFAALLAPIADAMAGYPWYISGTGGPDSWMMERSDGRLIVKNGADGVLCIALRDAGVGVAIKVESGRNDGIHAVAIAVLQQLGALNPEEAAALGDLSQPLVRNHSGSVVGQTRAVITLERGG